MDGEKFLKIKAWLPRSGRRMSFFDPDMMKSERWGEAWWFGKFLNVGKGKGEMGGWLISMILDENWPQGLWYMYRKLSS